MSGEAHWILVNHTKRQYYKGGERKESGMCDTLIGLLSNQWHLSDDIEEKDDDEGFLTFKWEEGEDKYEEL